MRSKMVGGWLSRASEQPMVGYGAGGGGDELLGPALPPVPAPVGLLAGEPAVPGVALPELPAVLGTGGLLAPGMLGVPPLPA
jgi:hypothetical protein